MRLLTKLALLIALTYTTTALAHHGWSSYDETKAIKLSGLVLSAKWENPHGGITMAYQGVEWAVVLAPISRMEARGLQSSALSEGKPVQIEAYPKRNGDKEMRAERITVDGKTVELR
jgi:Family of unknown function (DUF6152)